MGAAGLQEAHDHAIRHPPGMPCGHSDPSPGPPIHKGGSSGSNPSHVVIHSVNDGHQPSARLATTSREVSGKAIVCREQQQTAATSNLMHLSSVLIMGLLGAAGLHNVYTTQRAVVYPIVERADRALRDQGDEVAAWQVAD